MINHPAAFHFDNLLKISDKAMKATSIKTNIVATIITNWNEPMGDASLLSPCEKSGMLAMEYNKRRNACFACEVESNFINLYVIDYYYYACLNHTAPLFTLRFNHPEFSCVEIYQWPCYRNTQYQ
jgi:hypothetical protein